MHYRITARNLEQREALLDECERSGLKGEAFVRTVGISYPAFSNWNHWLP